jgi:hypothetical protein
MEFAHEKKAKKDAEMQQRIFDRYMSIVDQISLDIDQMEKEVEATDSTKIREVLEKEIKKSYDDLRWANTERGWILDNAPEGGSVDVRPMVIRERENNEEH